ncbi:hypothetical protein [Endozoicomonas sp. Mp262]|uniref:hypothetical protein n=1 Tax=Endozoicomonas sp. Mp262 TaxID=2919499 RepID=UPI0021DB6231
MKLLGILLLLAIALIVVIHVTERYAKPMSRARQAKLSGIITVLVFLLIIVQIVQGLLSV